MTDDTGALVTACEHPDEVLRVEWYDHIQVAERWRCAACGEAVHYSHGRRVEPADSAPYAPTEDTP